MNELITRKESTRYPGLFVKKYKKKVFFDNLWNESDELLEARGHVETADGKIVIRPFTKIFNRGENGTDIDRDEQVISIRKINGFMACATYVPEVGEVVVSTTGSLDSDFVKMAEEYITDDVKSIIKEQALKHHNDFTFIFEIVHPNDPHIIQEPFNGAYLIGLRRVSDPNPYMSDFEDEVFLDMMADLLGVHRPHWEICKFGDVVELSKSCKHEGFVVYGHKSKTALKIKSPYYLQRKFLVRTGTAKLESFLKSKDWKSKIDEEYYPLCYHIISIFYKFSQMTEQEKLAEIQSFINNMEA